MSLTFSMMYISPALLVILFGYIGFSESAPRISPSDASPVSSRKPGSASDTWDTFRPGEPRSATSQSGSLPAPPAGIAPEPTAPAVPGSRTATTFQPPTTDPTTTTSRTTDAGRTSLSQQHITAPSSRLSGARKRSTDAQTPLFSAEKMLQTMVSMVSQRTTNDAWPADSADALVTSVENSEEGGCNCSSGSEGIMDPDKCNQSTGQCSCLLGYTGLQCDECEEEYFTNGTSGCLPCSCDSFGAVDLNCDSSGTCACKTGVSGSKCDDCHPGFFHFSNTGCRPCQCNNHTNYCHPQSGMCVNCTGNTQGSNCDECKPGFYRSPGAALTEACAPCPCSKSTSTGTCLTGPSGSPVCDQCLSHYSGPHCDQCSPGFYNASGSGDCVPCDCSGNADPHGPAQLCDPKTGSCLSCINNTSGSRCQDCAPGFVGDARAHNCTHPNPRLIPAPAEVTTKTPTSSGSSPTSSFTSTTLTSTTTKGGPIQRSNNKGDTALSSTTTQALLTSLSSPTDNTTAALKEVSWTQFNVIILAVIILVVLLLLGFVGGVYTYREYQNRKLNAPFWTIELKEDNISFSSYHDSIPNADVSGLLEDEATEVAPNGQLALTTQANNYKA